MPDDTAMGTYDENGNSRVWGDYGDEVNAPVVLINCTPHTIHIVAPDGVTQDPKSKSYLAIKSDVVVIRDIPISGIVPRVAIAEAAGEPIDGIPTETLTYGQIDDLPEPKTETFYVVSALVATAAKALGRSDCLSPSKLVRNKDNPSEILGCLALGR